MLNTMFGDFEESLSLLEICRDGKNLLLLIIIREEEEKEEEATKSSIIKKYMHTTIWYYRNSLAYSVSLSYYCLLSWVNKEVSKKHSFFATFFYEKCSH